MRSRSASLTLTHYTVVVDILKSVGTRLVDWSSTHVKHASTRVIRLGAELVDLTRVRYIRLIRRSRENMPTDPMEATSEDILEFAVWLISSYR